MLCKGKGQASGNCSVLNSNGKGVDNGMCGS